MGRYGNVMLVGGETAPSFAARQGEVVRLYLTNTANTRVFNVALPGARMKLVGGDSGRVEREEFVESVVLAPSERVVVDVLFEEPGRVALEHRTPERTYTLATIDVAAEPATPPLADEFAVLRVNPEWAAERQRLDAYVDAAPDKTLAFVAEMDMGAPEGDVVYVCPMHPEVVGEESDRCPEVRHEARRGRGPGDLRLPDAPRGRERAARPLPEVRHEAGRRVARHGVESRARHHDHGHDHGSTSEHAHELTRRRPRASTITHTSPPRHDAGGIEWEDDMLELNRRTTPANMRWMLVDRDTGAANHGIEWQFTVGDRVKLRLVNEMDSDHPMHHPFHVHGAGRFVVLARDGVPEANYVWKDTVLVRTGETVDILLDVTNPGRWMAHCHIAEHHESGMMFSFDVAPAARPVKPPEGPSICSAAPRRPARPRRGSSSRGTASVVDISSTSDAAPARLWRPEPDDLRHRRVRRVARPGEDHFFRSCPAISVLFSPPPPSTPRPTAGRTPVVAASQREPRGGESRRASSSGSHRSRAGSRPSSAAMPALPRGSCPRRASR